MSLIYIQNNTKCSETRLAMVVVWLTHIYTHNLSYVVYTISNQCLLSGMHCSLIPVLLLFLCLSLSLHLSLFELLITFGLFDVRQIITLNCLAWRHVPCIVCSFSSCVGRSLRVPLCLCPVRNACELPYQASEACHWSAVSPIINFEVTAPSVPLMDANQWGCHSWAFSCRNWL